MFSSKDIIQLSSKGISLQEAERQLNCFQTGFPYLQIDRAATAGDGVGRLSGEAARSFERLFEQKSANGKMIKFVPASGAATRMFKDLYEFISSSGSKESASVKEVFDRLTDFAFYEALQPVLKLQGIDISQKRRIAEAILFPSGLNYGNLPKGLLLFHRYPDGARTAMEEHLAEGAEYARNADQTVHVHFTVSAEHQPGFEALVKEKSGKYAEKFGVTYHIGFSQQKSSTDTIAVDRNNCPMRDSAGNLLFRPGGHGALLENLNELETDIIHIKNIDNVVPDRLKSATITGKKVLAGLLIHLRDAVYGYIRRIRNGEADRELLDEILSFLRGELSFLPPAGICEGSSEKRKEYFLRILNRPIRVCGMVKNEGEPGGGPFWVRNADGSVSLQIAESSQINMNDPQQKAIAAQATHFNPVDLVCAVNDADGKHFDLLRYRDPDTGFISVKSKDGVELKAQELPGLWNGAMAQWNTVFVEVPVETFNPVKTVNDWLRPQHR
ncbi:MAG: DUF4301 family protein [Bacteroidales bacterium]|jgi:hypothetical protein|nr:DUF4301 family protein [Bacteroidales bacterium]